MSIFKKKKSNTAKIVATAVGAVAAGAAALYSTKKGKKMIKDASDGVTSLLKSTNKLKKTIKTVSKPVKKTVTKAAAKTVKAAVKPSRAKR